MSIDLKEVIKRLEEELEKEVRKGTDMNLEKVLLLARVINELKKQLGE
ncbi:MAG: hypothetical protein QXO22_08070 [Thermosphaera sp.]